jgi:hypothetical protein
MDVMKGNDCPVDSNYYHTAHCDPDGSVEGTDDGLNCLPADSCDYDHRYSGGIGLASQVFPDQVTVFEATDNFMLKGSPQNPCGIQQLEFQVFHTNWQTADGCLQGGGATCADKPTDYQGMVVAIMSDIDGAGGLKKPICKPRLPVTGQAPFHTPLNDDCQEVVFGAGFEDPQDPGQQHWYWDEIIGPTGQPAFIMHFNFVPTVRVAKNKKYWVSITTILPLSGKYQIAWSNTENFDGNKPKQFASNGTQEWETPVIVPVSDLYFYITGNKEAPGCGPCRLFGDLRDLGCIVDVGDLGQVLTAYSAPVQCSTISPYGYSPGSLDWNGMCPKECVTDADCVEAEPGGVAGDCIGTAPLRFCCSITQISEVLKELAAYAAPTPMASPCPNPCPPGGCVVPTACTPDPCCRDHTFIPGGTSEEDCYNLGGSYLGDNTTCAAAPMGTPLCSSCP